MQIMIKIGISQERWSECANNFLNAINDYSVKSMYLKELKKTF